MRADSIRKLTPAFKNESARVTYAQRVAIAIGEAIEADQTIATDMLLRGRIGLLQMDDAALLETGRDAWGVEPEPAELPSLLH